MRRVLTASVVGLLVALGASVPVAAHGGEILQLGAERIQPGGSIEVRGDLGSGEAFAVALVSKVDGSRRLIATLPAIEEGHFQSYVTIPTDVTTGEYLLEVAVDVDVIRAPLTVAGSPRGEEGGGGPDQEDGLIQPMPAVFGGHVEASAGGGNAARPGASDRAAGGEQSAATGTGRSPIDVFVLVGIVALAALALSSVRMIGRRRARGPVDPRLR